jgi:hypothetical protein
MTLYNKVILFIFIICTLPCNAQNFYDEQHSAKFADYLFQSQQYDLAANEYERLIYANSSENQYKLMLLRSYRKSGNLDLAQKRFSDIFKDSLYFTIEPVAQEYIHVLMLQNQLSDAAYFNQTHKNISQLQSKYNLMQLNLLAKNWKAADSIAQLINPLESQYQDILQSANSMKYRSPGLALVFSTVVPGTGKIYAGYWKDGLISLLFVAATGWQAYRGFDNKGVNSVSGWIWGSISTGFYFGNLYGSYKSAKRFNYRQNEILHKRAQNYIYSTF